MPGLTMQGMVDDDMFSISLSEEDDCSLYEKKDEQKRSTLDKGQSQTLDGMNEMELTCTLQSNQLLIDALEKEIIKRQKLINNNEKRKY